MIVVDASAALAWLLRQPGGDLAAERMFSPAETLHCPHLLDVEVAQALRKLVLRKVMTAEEGLEALEDLAGLPISRYAHEPLLPRIWELHSNLTAYDAVYIALAEVLGATLLTCDGKLRSASTHHATVEVI